MDYSIDADTPPEVECKVKQSRDRQLAGRAVLGAVVYPLCFLMIAVPTGLSSREPYLCAVFFSTLCSLALARTAICLSFDKLYPSHRLLWRLGFIASVAGLGLAWGLVAAHGLFSAPWSPATLLFLFSGSGFAGGMIATLAIDRTVYRIYLICLLVPPGFAAVLAQGDYGGVLAGFHLLYFLFLWIQGKRQSEEFQISARKTFLIIEQRDQLVTAIQSAEQASLAKSRLLANVSHELRTPMNAIVGTTEWALEQEALPTDRGLWDEVHNAGIQLLTMIDQVLDFSKIDSGVLSAPKTEPFLLANTVSQVDSLFQRTARQKGLKLTFHLDTESSAHFIMGDDGRLRQILLNLVGNAIKFTEQGEVNVRLKHADETLNVEVSDTGPGIPEEVFERIFEPFYQADSTSSRRYGGAGLGLAICKELIHSLGGEVKLKSTLGEGTTFRVKLPAPPAESAASPEVEEFRRSYTVLVVDDDPTNLQVAVRQLGHLGMSVDVARSGDEAVRKCSGRKYDLILMDLQMPMVDGFRVTQNIQTCESGLNHSTPIIAFTAHVGEEERSKCEQAGMVAFFNKPLQRAVLTRELLHLEELGLLQKPC